MKSIKKMLVSWFVFLLLPLNANVPNWSFDDINNGWNSNSLAKMYFHHSETQRQWAWELLSKVPFKGSEKILDFGCGDRKITAEISRLVPNGSVLGIDLSSEMLHLAQMKFPSYAYSNLEFKKNNSLTFSDFTEEQAYDIICSFAVFHLIADPLETLKNLKANLKPTGKLLLVITTGTNPVIYQAANEIFAKYGIEAPWKSKQVSKEIMTMRTLEGCSHLLKEAGYRILSLEIIDTDNAFYDLDELIVWMVGTVTANWNIPLSLSRNFFTDLVHRMYDLEPKMIDKEGRVLFKMPRIHAIASPLNE